ncbi:hypothetical protein GCM10023322_07490 [Rugosimonospora acidiphila]|uniref:Uncharacterized protein n=1 Tax=Rugosimonospora acidiphila TaxID=556531 RepID=A0ABP9RJM2_9ACTN
MPFTIAFIGVVANHRYRGGVIWFGALWHVVGVLIDVGPSGLLVGTAAATGILLTAMLAASILLRRVVADSCPGVTRRVLRQHAQRTGIPRHRDPDAAGRSRPRAPTAVLAAA